MNKIFIYIYHNIEFMNSAMIFCCDYGDGCGIIQVTRENLRLGIKD
jgi:hypothetical protein